MFKKEIISFCFLLFYFNIAAQQIEEKSNHIDKDKYENKNDLEGFYYAYLDYFVKNKKELTPDFITESFALQWREPQSENEWIAKLHLLINKAYYLKENGKIQSSILVYEKAFNLYKNKSLKNYHIINYCLKPLANNYTRIGDYKRAEELLKYTISIAKEQNNKEQIIATYLNLSIKYQSTGNFNKAISLLKEAMHYQPNKKQLALIYSQLAKYQLLAKHPEIAKKTVLQAKKMDINNRYVTTNNATLASYFKLRKKYDKAYNLLLDNLKQIHSKRQKAKTYIEIASIDLLKHDTIKSLKNLNNALTTLLPKFKPKHIFVTPNSTQFYPENTIKEALDAKALIFEKTKKYTSAISHYKQSFVIEDMLRNSYLSQKAKLLQQTENRKRSEKLVLLYDKIYQDVAKDSIIIKMIESVEYTKARVLSNTISKELRLQLVNEDSIYKKQQLLKKKIAIIDNKIQQESLTIHPNISILEELNLQKTILNTDFTLLNKELMKKYPFLNGLQFDFNFNTIKNTLLNKPNHCIVYFFNTSKYLFTFIVTKDKIQYKKIYKTDEYTRNLDEFIALFSKGRPDTIENDILKYKHLGFQFYELFFKEIPKAKTFYTIIADQNLNFLPFDALLTEESSSNNFATLPYLVKTKTINLGYSLKILSQLKRSSKDKKLDKIIGFFPVFDSNYRNNKTLSYTRVEKDVISSYFKGLYLESKQATKDNFLNKASNYDIIHISTHADAGDRNHTAKIEFYDKTLFLPEIYGLQFKSNLMVLSACETGIGKIEKGEGVMSLSRGFSYAGIPNLVVSLWKVNDQSTSVLMGEFYKNLKKTKSIDKSLQKAKIAYLNSKKVSMYKKNPYYWSGFIFLGNTDDGIIENSNTLLYIFLAFGIIFLIIIITIKQKKH